MATLLGVNATKLRSDDPSDHAGVGEQGANLRLIYDTFELSADLVGGTDTIRMGGLLPKGARVIDVHIFFDDLDASGGTLDIGWEISAVSGEAADANGFLSAVAVTSAGAQSMLGDQPTVAGVFKKFTEAVQPVVAPNGDTDATSGTISLAILYSID